MAKKYYAVLKGKSNTPKIFESWDECKSEVSGVSGAKYKSFSSREEAESFILRENKCDVVSNNDILIYVDGSFSEKAGNYSYGFVVVTNNEILYEENGVGFNEEAKSLRNVSGEIKGTMAAIEYAIKNNMKNISIVYDYLGIECWALGTWKRNNRITRGYHTYINSKKDIIKINFIKVKGHSNNPYNDRADALAKQALGI